MKIKSTFPILLLVTSFLISGCGKTNQPSNEISAPITSSELSSEQAPVSSEDKGGASSEQINTSKETPVSSNSTRSDNSSTSSGDIPGGDTYLVKDINVPLAASLRESETPHTYNLSFKYDDRYFLGDAQTYNKDLAMLSLGLSIATGDSEQVADFFDAIDMMGPDFAINDYEHEPDEAKAGYVLAHKAIDDFDLIVIAFRGFNYGQEWANNFTVGDVGNHSGFEAVINDVFTSVNEYIFSVTNGSNKPIKCWITGYSRGGALAQLFAQRYFDENTGDYDVLVENRFVYTFEAPASHQLGGDQNRYFDITNRCDLIASIPPQRYDLYRIGKTIDIYNESVSTLLKQFDSEAVVPEFVSNDSLTGVGISNDESCLEYVMNQVFNKEEVDEDKSIYANTREQYYQNYQDGLAGCIGYIFALTPATRSALLTDLQNLGFGAISILGDASGKSFMDFLKPYLDQDNVTYDETTLQANCAVLVKAIGNLFLGLLLMYLSNDTKPALTRLIDMHYPEVTYVLLKEYNRTLEL